MDSMDDIQYKNKREYSRVTVNIPLNVRLVSDEELQTLIALSDMNQLDALKIPPEVEDPVLSAWLNFISLKLDIIMRMISPDKGCMSAYKMEDISGGGISFTSHEHFSLGNILEIKLFPSSIASQPLYLYGEVVQSEKVDVENYTAVRFIRLDDEIREKIIHIVFERERTILREKTGSNL